MANIKISELNPLLTVEDADVLPIVDNAITKKVTAAILRSYTQGNSVLLTGAQTVAGIKTFTSQLASSVATGTAPFSVASTTKVTNLNADLLDGLSSADFQATLSGTGIVKSTAGTISYLTDNSTNWNTAFNDKINSATVTGSGTNTLTLTQQDAGTITATWVNGTLIREIRNNTGATLTKGTIVYISGATGNKPTVSKALATGDSTSAQTFGFVQEDILNNANGYVVIIGDLIGVDTSAFTEGDQLYLSSTVAGAFTTVKQYAPNHLVYVGIVTRSHPTLGQIEVNIQNGYEMDELHNVSAQNPSNGDILQFVTSTGLWTKVAGTTTNISEGTNLYFTNARSRSAISLTTTGTSGAATYNSTTGVLNVPNYADGGITSLNGLTALTQTFAVGTSGTDFGISSATSTHTFNLPTASAANRGALSSADWTTFNNKQNALTNPITGTGTTNYLPKFTGASALGNSLLQESTVAIGLGITPSAWYTNFGTKAIQFAASGSVYGLDVSSSDRRAGLMNNAFINSSGNYTYINTGHSTQYEQNAGKHTWSTAASGTAGNAITFTAGMTLDASGNLLIGTTTSSTFKLDVNGTARVVGAVTTNSASGFRLDSAGSILFSLGYSGGTLLDRLTATSFRIAENGTPQLTLATGGAATFSSTVTTSGKLTVDNNSGISILASTNFGMNMYFNSATGYSYIDSKYDSAGAGRLYIRTRTNGTPVNALMFLGTGDATFASGASVGTGLALNGGAIPASGIQFPATQVASASANNLDDYEEGTFTPTFTGSTTNPTVTYAVQSGIYTKIGRQVTCSIEIGTTANTGGVGAIRVSGLPFTIGIRSYMSVATYNIDNSAATPLGIFAEIGSGNTRFDLLQTADNGNWSTMNWTQATNAEVYVNATITYFV